LRGSQGRIRPAFLGSNEIGADQVGKASKLHSHLVVTAMVMVTVMVMVMVMVMVTVTVMVMVTVMVIVTAAGVAVYHQLEPEVYKNVAIVVADTRRRAGS